MLRADGLFFSIKTFQETNNKVCYIFAFNTIAYFLCEFEHKNYYLEYCIFSINI